MSSRKELGKSPSSQAPAVNIPDPRHTILWISHLQLTAALTDTGAAQPPQPSLLSAVFFGVVGDPSCMSPRAAHPCVCG